MSKSTLARTLVLAAVIAFSGTASRAPAQGIDARLGGTVSDPTGALIPGVTINARNVGTGITNTSITNESGTYQFPNLQPGNYEVSAELPGFQAQRYTEVALGGGQQARLNFVLQVAEVATTVEVTAAGGALVTTSSSIQSVLGESQVLALPLGNRDIRELLAGMAGTGPTDGNLDGFFAGNRLNAVNVTRDGMPVGTGRYDQGTLSASYISPDLVEEVRVTTGTVDAEATRGSGQVAMVTRSGTNEFRGSVFWFNRNSALQAANWFNNFNDTEADWENRNQYGVRFGGPIIRDKTFFFVLVDNQRTAIREDFVGMVLTNEARQGLFRFFPGADNRNALQSNPTVDLDGNALPPAGQTLADLSTVDLFGQGRGDIDAADPNRAGFDPTGYIQNVVLGRMPQPNDFTVGDGLNTAGIRFSRRIYGLDTNIQDTVDRNNRDQVNVRIDHYFNPDNKLSFIYTWESSDNLATAQGIREWPNSFDGANSKYPRIYNLQLVSTVTPNVVNEFRWGYRVHDVRGWPPYYVGVDLRTGGGQLTPEAQEAFDLLPHLDGEPIPRVIYPVLLGLGQSPVGQYVSFGSHRGSYSPLMTFGDNLSWNHGTHAFKLGGEYRRDRTDGYNDNDFTPRVEIGAGNFPAPISSATVAGLTSTNATLARNTLYNLAGSINRVRQGFDLASSEPPLEFQGYAEGNNRKIRDWHASELNLFFKDDWKVTSNLTLNLGVKWEWYGVPYESRGLAGRIAGGYDGVCTFSDCGPVTVELVGKNSPQPDKQIFNDDFNNFAPAVGFSWQLPWVERTTILRGGYGISYAGRQIIQVMGAGGLDAGAGTLPGLAGISGGNGLDYFQTSYWDLANLQLPMQPLFAPLSAVPLTDSRALTMNAYEPDRTTPYIQNFTLSIQHDLALNWTLDVSYVGSKGSQLYGRLPLNVVDIYGTGFLDAFNVTRAGGDAALFDSMLMGLNFPGIGVVDGQNLTGSEVLRRYTPTRANLANGEAGAVADFLNRSPNITGEGGGFVRNAGLPEDFFLPYPQFNEMGLNGNNGSSTYHSMQVQVTKRLSNGFANQTSYTWSKNLGISDSDHNLYARDPRDRQRDKALLGFHRTHIITSNATWELPIGAGRTLLSNASGWVENLIGGWQMGGLFRWASGAPLTVTAGGLSNIWQQANNTSHQVGELPELAIVKHSDGRRPTYFGDLTPVLDPGSAGVTTANNLRAAYSLRAIVDGQGNLVFVNPGPGDVGSLGLSTIEGPGRFQLDMNLQKRIRVDERRDVEVRMDVTNILNHPVFNNPVTNINSATFGQITTADDARKIVLGVRLNF